ncbi:MAG: polysaccharide export protein [Candidatus Eremiobacteraeota bacterium]|nr:polysaccharide export protein [Candidatus Eremiobacteraeota bacterium]
MKADGMKQDRHFSLKAATNAVLVAVTALFLIAVAGAARADSATGYLIHGSDQLNVVVYGDSSLTQTVTVLPDGDISMPLVGPVHVGGLTPAQAAQKIARSLQKFVKHPVVSVSVAQEGQLSVLVLGNVKTPGKYQLPPNSHVTDAIAAAGGIGPTDGPYPDARVGASTGATSTVSLQKLLHDGDTAQNLAVQDSTIVYIPSPVQITVEVLGSVDHPGEIPLNEGDRLSMAIAKAGNSQAANSDLNRIHVTRNLPSGQVQNFDINLYEKLQQGDLSKDLVMQRGDVVYVPQAKKGSASGLAGGASLLYTLRLLLLHF